MTETAPRTAVPHPVNGAGLPAETSHTSVTEGQPLLLNGDRLSTNGDQQAEEEEGNESDQHVYSQRLGKMTLYSEAASAAGDGEGDPEMLGDSMDTSNGLNDNHDFLQHRARQETAETSQGELHSTFSIPPSSAAKRKLPASAFSSDSSIISQDQDPALISVSSSALSSSLHRFKPAASFIANMTVPAYLQAGPSVISTSNEKTPTKSNPTPYRAPSPATSLSELSDLSDLSDNDEKEPDSPARRRTQAPRPPQTSMSNGSRAGGRSNGASPNRQVSSSRRRSTRSTANQVASYADSESESDPDHSSSLSRSRNTKPVGRARKQRRISAQG